MGHPEYGPNEWPPATQSCGGQADVGHPPAYEWVTQTFMGGPPAGWATQTFTGGHPRSALLLVVESCGGTGLTGAIVRAEVDCAGFAVRGGNDARSIGNLAVLLIRQEQGVGVDLLVGAGVRGGASGDGIVFAVELADPFRVRGISLAVHTVVDHFDLIAFGCVCNRGGVGAASGQCGLGFVELPRAQVVLSGAQLNAEERKGESEEEGSEFHVYLRIWRRLEARLNDVGNYTREAGVFAALGGVLAHPSTLQTHILIFEMWGTT